MAPSACPSGCSPTGARGEPGQCRLLLSRLPLPVLVQGPGVAGQVRPPLHRHGLRAHPRHEPRAGGEGFPAAPRAQRGLAVLRPRRRELPLRVRLVFAAEHPHRPLRLSGATSDGSRGNLPRACAARYPRRGPAAGGGIPRQADLLELRADHLAPEERAQAGRLPADRSISR